MTDTAAFEAQRSRLIGIAYRMLGDVAAAEDVVQEAYLRWSERSANEEVRSTAAFLTTVVTRLAIDRLRSASTRREAYVGPWLAEPVLFAADEGGPEDVAVLAESVTLGFLQILDALTPMERAVFLLHDAFDFSFAEIGTIVGRSEVTCRKMASRARAKVGEHRSARRRAPSQQESELVAAFASALATADVDQIQRLLTAGVVATSDGGGVRTAAVRPVVGAHRVARFFAGVAKRPVPDLRVDESIVNGEPAFLLWSGETLDTVLVVGVTPDGIDHIHTVRNPDKLEAIARGYRLPI